VRGLGRVFAAVLAGAAIALSGCAAAGDADEPATAQLVLPLVQPGSAGELYHLANATFDITALNSSFAATVDGSGSESSLAVALPPGLFTVQLRDGWTLEKSVDGGASFAPVSALLGTTNPSTARALAGQPVIVEFGFVIRNADSTAQITLGVEPHPRELAGGFVVTAATDGLADYAVSNRQLDFAVFFQLGFNTLETLADGTKERVYTAGPFGVANAFFSGVTPVATEFYNDHIGTLAGAIAHDLQGAFLQYRVGLKPDGSFELSGQLIGGATDVEFGPNAIDVDLPGIGSDGFPNDAFFYDSTLPFTMTSGEGTITGVLRMRQLLPPQ
jgi:hypothetical protein